MKNQKKNVNSSRISIPEARSFGGVEGDVTVTSPLQIQNGAGLRNSVRKRLYNDRLRDGLVVTSDGITTTTVNFTMPRREMLKSVGAITFEEPFATHTGKIVNPVRYRSVFLNKTQAARVKANNTEGFLRGVLEAALESKKVITLLCSDQVVMGQYCELLKSYDVDFFKIELNRRTSTDQIRKIVRIMTIVDFIIESANPNSFVMRTKCVIVLDEHLRTPPYIALSYVLNNKDYDFRILLHTTGNSKKVAGFPLQTASNIKLVSLDFEYIYSDKHQQNNLKNLRNKRVLFILSNQQECSRARPYLSRAGFKDVEVIGDDMTSNDLYTLWANCRNIPFVILCTGWVERFMLFKFDVVYDCGRTTELYYDGTLSEKTRKLWPSEFKYRQCISPYYYNYSGEQGLTAEHTNDNSNMNVLALLKYHNVTPEGITLGTNPGIMNELSTRAISTYFSVTLPLAIMSEYMDVAGDIKDNYSAAVSLFSVRDRDFTSTGTEKDAREYDSWMSITNARTLISDYDGYLRIPVASYIDKYTQAMLIINTFKTPSIVESLIRIGKMPGPRRREESRHSRDIRSPVRVLHSSTSTPLPSALKTLSSRSPLSPSSISERIRTSVEKTGVKNSIPEESFRPTHKRKVSIVLPEEERQQVISMSDSAHEGLFTFESDEEEAVIDDSGNHTDDSDAQSMYSFTSKMSVKKKNKSKLLPRSSSLKRATADLQKRMENADVEKHRVSYHLSNTFGGLSNRTKPKKSKSEEVHYKPVRTVSSIGNIKELCSIKINEYITPELSLERYINIQTAPKSEDILLICKLVKSLTAKNKMNCVTGLSPRSTLMLLVAICVCWNRLVSGAVISERDMSMTHRVLLTFKYNGLKIKDVVTIPNLMHLSKMPSMKNQIVHVEASK